MKLTVSIHPYLQNEQRVHSLTTEFGRPPVSEVHAVIVLAILDQLTGDLTDVVIHPAHIVHTGGLVLLQIRRLHLSQTGLQIIHNFVS